MPGMAARLPVLRSGEVDGVPAFWVKRPGPLRVSLSFRVGQADEPLPVRGISHMVEHLALHELHSRGYAYNGMVDEDRTSGYASGTPEEAVDFLGSFTRSLSNLPVDRIQTERRILRTEATRRGYGAYDLLLVNRYGARGYGRPAYDEYGLRWLTEERVLNWAATRFTRGNAALFLSGPPPAGLALHLPDGERMPPPETEPVVDLPAWMTEDLGGVAISLMTERSVAAVAATTLLARRLQQRLRHDEGVVYAVESSYSRRGPDLAESMFWLRALDECHRQVVEGTTEILAGLANGEVTDDELRYVREQTEQRLADPDWVLGFVDSAVYDELVGAPVRAVRELVTEQRECRAEQIAEAWRTMTSTALVAVPLGARMPEPYVPVPSGSGAALSGTEYEPAGPKAPQRLVVAAEGVSYKTGDGPAITVRFDQCEAVLWWTDGSRRLVGHDGFSVSLTPESWTRYREALAAVDAAVPRERWVPMGDRVDPPPIPPEPIRNPVEFWKRKPGVRIVVLLVLALFAMIYWGEWSTWRGGTRPTDAWTSSTRDALIGAAVFTGLTLAVAVVEALLRLAAVRARIPGSGSAPVSGT